MAITPFTPTKQWADDSTFTDAKLDAFVDALDTWLETQVEAKLPDKTGTETITGSWTFPNGIEIASLKFDRTARGAGPYNMQAGDTLIAKTAISGGGDTITLLSAATAGAGYYLIIADESGTAATNNITVAPAGSETISGASSQLISDNYGVIIIYSNGTNWFSVPKDVNTWGTITGNTGSISPDSESDNFSITGDGVNTLTTAGSGNVTVNLGTVQVNKGGTGQTTYTNGQLLIGNSTGNTLTKATLTEGDGIDITNGTGSITIINSYDLQLGETANIGFTLSSGTFTITQADGSAFADSSGNRGYVCVGSTTTGRSVVLEVTANQSFRDDANATASDIVGEEFGVTSGVAWGQDRPFYLYAVNADNTNANLLFALSPNPSATQSPASTNIGYKLTPAATPSDNNFFFFTSTNVTTTHNAKPCVCIGAIRMRMTSSDDWTVQALNQADGIGKFHEATIFAMPLGQQGAAAGHYMLANGGTAPVFSLYFYEYEINRQGRVVCRILMSGDGGTDGAGAVSTRVVLPYATRAAAGAGNYIQGSGLWVTGSPDSRTGLVFQGLTTTKDFISLFGSVGATSQTTLHSIFVNGAREFVACLEYRAF